MNHDIFRYDYSAQNDLSTLIHRLYLSFFYLWRIFCKQRMGSDHKSFKRCFCTEMPFLSIAVPPRLVSTCVPAISVFSNPSACYLNRILRIRLFFHRFHTIFQTAVFLAQESVSVRMNLYVLLPPSVHSLRYKRSAPMRFPPVVYHLP